MSESTTAGTEPKSGEATGNADAAKFQEQINSLIAERDTLKTQLRDKANAAKSAEQIAKERDELMDKLSKTQEQFDGYKAEVKQRAVNTHIQTALDASGAHNAERVKAMLDMSKVKVADDGQVDQASLAEAIKALKTSDPYLFKQEQKGDSTDTKESGSTTPGQLPAIKGAADSKSGDPFTLELDAAKKAKDPFKAIEQVLRKYGKA